MVAEGGTRSTVIADHNGEGCYDELRKAEPDLIILGNTRIVHEQIFSAARIGCLNGHNGLLPEVRGSGPICWALIHDLPQGCSCHFVNRGVDAGPLISRKEIPVYRGMLYGHIVRETVQGLAGLLVEAVRRCGIGDLTAIPQDLSIGRCYTWPSEEIFRRAEQKLVDQTYRCYAD
jgi:methionyl-tRNA formyltransferase